MSSTEAILENHKVRIEASEKRQDRVETILIGVAGMVIVQLATAVATLIMLLAKKG